MELLLDSELLHDKRKYACIYSNGIFFKDDSHFACCILRLEKELSKEEFELLEENDFIDVDEYDNYESGTYGAIYVLDNKEVFITFEEPVTQETRQNFNEIKEIMPVYYYKGDSDIILEY